MRLHVGRRLSRHGSFDFLGRLRRLSLDRVLPSGHDVAHEVERLGSEVRSDGGGTLLGRHRVRARGDQGGRVAEVFAQVQTLAAAQVLNEEGKNLTGAQMQTNRQSANNMQTTQSDGVTQTQQEGIALAFLSVALSSPLPPPPPRA